MLGLAGNRIGRLRIVGAEGQSGSARLAAQTLLDRADLMPPGMPPAAVLIVRRLTDPLPGWLPQRLADGGIDAGWERAARARMSDAYHRATRPARGDVGEEAGSVVFADEAELLACLAYDLATGAGSRWWWRTLMPGGGLRSTASLARLLGMNALAVPAALSWLAQRRRAVPVLRGLAPVEARAVLRAVCAAHGLADLTAPRRDDDEAIPSPPLMQDAEPGPTSGADQRSPEPHGQARLRDASAAPAEVAPWAAWMPLGADDAHLVPEQVCLLGVAATIHAQPQIVRSPRFVAAVRHWIATRRTGPSGHLPVMDLAGRRDPGRQDPAARSGALPVRPGLTARTTVGDQDGAVAAETPPTLPARGATESWMLLKPSSRPRDGTDTTVPTGTVLPDREPALARDPPKRHSPAGVSAPAAPANEHPDAPLPSRTADEQQSASDRATARPPSVDALPPPTVDQVPQTDALCADAREEAPSGDLSLEGGVETALGGVLFVINAMLALDLPDCFEPDWQLATRLGPWGTLEALARALLAPSSPEDPDDLLWAALAALAGHDPEAALGAGLPRRARFALPSGWPRPPGPSTGPTGDAGLMPRGACVADVERGRIGLALARLLTRDSLTASMDPALRRWLLGTVPSIRQRLVSALSRAGDDSHAADPIAALLRRPGRLHVTLTHVDLVMPLEGVSLPVRLAGLDRDPGWLAGFGRVVLFHFA